MDRDLIVGAIGVGGAILGSITGVLASGVIAHVSSLRKERTRVLIEIEEYLDQLWDVSNALYHLKDRELSCTDEAEEKNISSAYNHQLDKFFSIWDLRKRIIELNIYFNDHECSYIFRKIERLYERCKNKTEALSPFPIIDNDKLLEGLINIEEEIYDLRENLSRRLRLHLTFKYILFPTFLKWFFCVKGWLMKPADTLENTD